MSVLSDCVLRGQPFNQSAQTRRTETESSPLSVLANTVEKIPVPSQIHLKLTKAHDCHCQCVFTTITAFPVTHNPLHSTITLSIILKYTENLDTLFL